jgi:hypothetical protein
VVKTMRAMLAAGFTVLACGASPSRVEAHPLHSTITEVVTDLTRGTARATIRVFADDLRAGVVRSAGGRSVPAKGPAWEAAVLAYVASAFGLQDARGRPLPLRSCGLRRTADLVWLCVETHVASDGVPLRVRNAMLCELYEDQVNVVQGDVGGSRRTLLFVRGDRLKVLR